MRSPARDCRPVELAGSLDGSNLEGTQPERFAESHAEVTDLRALIVLFGCRHRFSGVKTHRRAASSSELRLVKVKVVVSTLPVANQSRAVIRVSKFF